MFLFSYIMNLPCFHFSCLFQVLILWYSTYVWIFVQSFPNQFPAVFFVIQLILYSERNRTETETFEKCYWQKLKKLFLEFPSFKDRVIVDAAYFLLFANADFHKAVWLSIKIFLKLCSDRNKCSSLCISGLIFFSRLIFIRLWFIRTSKNVKILSIV